MKNKLPIITTIIISIFMLSVGFCFIGCGHPDNEDDNNDNDNNDITQVKPIKLSVPQLIWQEDKIIWNEAIGTNNYEVVVNESVKTQTQNYIIPDFTNTDLLNIKVKYLAATDKFLDSDYSDNFQLKTKELDMPVFYNTTGKTETVITWYSRENHLLNYTDRIKSYTFVYKNIEYNITPTTELIEDINSLMPKTAGTITLPSSIFNTGENEIYIKVNPDNTKITDNIYYTPSQNLKVILTKNKPYKKAWVENGILYYLDSANSKTEYKFTETSKYGEQIITLINDERYDSDKYKIASEPISIEVFRLNKPEVDLEILQEDAMMTKIKFKFKNSGGQNKAQNGYCYTQLKIEFINTFNKTFYQEIVNTDCPDREEIIISTSLSPVTIDQVVTKIKITTMKENCVFSSLYKRKT